VIAPSEARPPRLHHHLLALGLVCALTACSSDPDAADGGKHAGVGTAGRDGGAAGSAAAGSSGGSGDASTSNDGSAGSGHAGNGNADTGTVRDAGSSFGESFTRDCAQSHWNPDDFNRVFDVGPGHPYATPSDVPWESMGPGTLVRIHAWNGVYRDKWVLNVAGTADQPVVVRGVPSDGVLPVIFGEDAVTRAQLNYWGEERAVIKIGGSNTPDNAAPSHVFVECLNIARARPGYSYTGDDAQQHEYAENAAAITVESGEHITLRNNVFTECGNGLFTAAESSDVRVIGNLIHGNGNVGSIYEHNSYTESAGILFEANAYGPLCSGCLGNNLKDRSAGSVIRYNSIRGGNRQLDLVDSDHAELLSDLRYAETFVYGNLLVEPDGEGNGQIVHYGGDSGDTTRYRKGTLHFFHNTVVSERTGNTTLVRLSSADETVDARNNVIYASAGGSTLAISDGDGTALLRTNWLPTGFRESHGTLLGMVQDLGNVTGSDPGFVDVALEDFALAADSACLDQAGPVSAETSSHPVSWQYEAAGALVARPEATAPDLGAFER
jgi:hypothetical protein